MKTLRFAVFLLTSFAIAQTPVPPKPADSPAPLTLAPSPAKDALYAAIHRRDQIEKQMTDLNLRFSTLQAQATQQFKELQDQDAKAGAALDAAKTEALKAAKLDPAKYSLDLDTMQVIPNPEPKAVAQTPVQKK